MQEHNSYQKAADRAEIAHDVDKYLQGGGTITEIPYGITCKAQDDEEIASNDWPNDRGYERDGEQVDHTLFDEHDWHRPEQENQDV